MGCDAHRLLQEASPELHQPHCMGRAAPGLSAVSDPWLRLLLWSFPEEDESCSIKCSLDSSQSSEPSPGARGCRGDVPAPRAAGVMSQLPKAPGMMSQLPEAPEAMSQLPKAAGMMSQLPSPVCHGQERCCAWGLLLSSVTLSQAFIPRESVPSCCSRQGVRAESLTWLLLPWSG